MHRRRKRGGQGGYGPLTFLNSPSKCGKNYAHAQQYSSRKVANFACGRSAVVLLCLLVILLDIAKEFIEVNDRRMKFFGRFVV